MELSETRDLSNGDSVILEVEISENDFFTADDSKSFKVANLGEVTELTSEELSDMVETTFSTYEGFGQLDDVNTKEEFPTLIFQ